MTLAGTLVRLPFFGVRVAQELAVSAVATATALPRLVVALEKLGEARPALDRLAAAADGLEQLSEVAPILERLGAVLEEAQGPLERLVDVGDVLAQLAAARPALDRLAGGSEAVHPRPRGPAH